MVIMITDRCGLCCPYCLVDTVSPDGEHMSETNFNLALELAKRIEENIIIIAGGEPFNHPLFMKFVAQAKDAGFWIGITTNGIKLVNDWDAIDYFAKLKNSKVQVTTHTLTWKEHKNALRFMYVNDSRFRTKKSPKKFFPSMKARKNYPEHALTDNNYCQRLRKAALKASIVDTSKPVEKSKILQIIKSYNFFPSQNGCSIHVHRDGTLRAGPSSFCQKLGTLTEALKNFDAWSEAATTLLCKSCTRCSGSETNITEKDRRFFKKLVSTSQNQEQNAS